MKITSLRTAVIDGNFHLTDDPGHGLTLNEDAAQQHLKERSSFFGEYPYSC